MSKNPVTKMIRAAKDAAYVTWPSPPIDEMTALIAHQDVSDTIKTSLQEIVGRALKRAALAAAQAQENSLEKIGVTSETKYNPSIFQFKPIDLIEKLKPQYFEKPAKTDLNDHRLRASFLKPSLEEKDVALLATASPSVLNSLDGDDLYSRLLKLSTNVMLDSGDRSTIKGLSVKRGLEIIREAEVETGTKILGNIDDPYDLNRYLRLTEKFGPRL